VIFVRKDIVRGLTTASTVWLVAAVGMACGGGLPILAMAVTVGHFIVVTLFPIIERKLPKSRWSPTRLQVSYRDGKGILRDILVVCTQQEFSVSRTAIRIARTARGSGKKREKKARIWKNPMRKRRIPCCNPVPALERMES
jgi:putative Mg2+ transporter-C (MgtC) family protein